MKRGWVAAALALLVTVALGPGAPPEVAAQAPRVAHFYAINAVTGASAPYGGKNVEGNRLAVKAINDGGGFADSCGNRYTAKLTVFDMANSREQAIAGLRQAAEDRTVLGIVGPSPSVGFVPMVPVAGQLKMPLTATGSVAPIREWNPYTFRLSIPAAQADVAALRVLKQKFGVDKLAIIYEITGDGPRGSAEALRNAAGQVGYEVVAFEAYRNTDTDFRPQLTKIKATGAPWIAMEGVLDHYAQVVNQAAELGIKARWFTGAGAANAIDPRGWDLTEGKIREHYTVSAYFSLNDPRRPEVNRFVSLYRAEFKTDPTLLSFYGWDAVQLYVDAVKRACTDTDREKFREALARTKDFPGLSGAITFANPPTGEVQNPTILVTATTGKGTWEEVR